MSTAESWDSQYTPDDPDLHVVDSPGGYGTLGGTARAEDDDHIPASDEYIPPDDDGLAEESTTPRDQATEPSIAQFLLPREVWDGSPVMQHIYQAAMSRIACPDAVLHALLAELASQLHHDSRILTGKGPTVPSYFVAPIADSGGGKTESVSCAHALLQTWADGRYKQDEYIDAPLGSGEGLIEAFMGEKEVEYLNSRGEPDSRTERCQVRHNALFRTDEGRQILAIDSRKGATILAVLCELWSGSAAGQTNADKYRTRKLAEGSYVVGIVAGFQTGTIDPLFADESGGAPQRFAFTPAVYPPHADNLDAPEEPWPGALQLDIPTAPVTVALSEMQQAEVRRHVRLRAAGMADDGPLDGHRMLLRCRIAGLLTLLHGERKVSADMWWLAGEITDRSCALRDWLADEGRRRERRRREAHQQLQVETAQRADRVVRADRDVERAAAQLVRAVERAGGELTAGKAINGLRSDLRQHKAAALELALSDGRLVQLDGGKRLRLGE